MSYYQELLAKVAKSVTVARQTPLPDKYEIARLREMVEGLFSFSKFKEGDRVKMAATVPVNEKEAPGWWCYRHLLTKGSRATIKEVDWYEGSFRYRVLFEENSWMDDQGKIKPCSSEPGLFTLSEKWLKK